MTHSKTGRADAAPPSARVAPLPPPTEKQATRRGDAWFRSHLDGHLRADRLVQEKAPHDCDATACAPWVQYS